MSDGRSFRDLRIAYLNTRYPCLSHTFIEREVRALRSRGVEVHTFSIRRPVRDDVLGAAHEEAARGTVYILDGVIGLAAAQAWAIISRPLRFVRGIIAAQRLSPPGIRARLLHTAYLVEAVKLVREMRKRGVQHVHVHMANNGAAVAMLAAVVDPSMRYSLTIHGSAEFFNVETGRLRAKAEGATFVRCVSEFCRAQVMAWTSPTSWSRYSVVHCGVDIKRFSPRPPMMSGPLRMLTVGRMEPVKGYPVLLMACSQLSAMGIEWQLDMVGGGPLRDSLECQARNLGIAGRIIFSGAVGQDAILEHFDQADVLVVSSFMEGVPVVLMEAMAKGLAVVSTSIGGVPELIEHGVNGVLVRPGSVELLTLALTRLARDRALLASFGEVARKRIVEEFSIETVGAQMSALFADGKQMRMEQACAVRAHRKYTKRDNGVRAARDG